MQALETTWKQPWLIRIKVMSNIMSTFKFSSLHSERFASFRSLLIDPVIEMLSSSDLPSTSAAQNPLNLALPSVTADQASHRG